MLQVRPLGHQFVQLHPEDRANALNRLFDRTGNAVGGYVRGALLQALIAGVTSWIVVEIIGAGKFRSAVS